MNNKLPLVQVNCTFDNRGDQVTRVKFYGDLHTAIERIAESLNHYEVEGYMNDFEVSDTSKRINARLEKLCKEGYGFIDVALGRYLECERGYLPANIRTIILDDGNGWPSYDWYRTSGKDALKQEIKYNPWKDVVAIDLLEGKVYAHKAA